MTYLVGRRQVRPEQRLYDLFHTLTTTVDALAIAESSLTLKEPLRQFTGQELTFVSRQFPVQVRIPIGWQCFSIVHEAAVHDVPVIFETRTLPAPPPYTYGFDEVLLAALRALLVDFYEGHKTWIRDQYSGDYEKWPEIFRFAWAIRNASSHHRGKLNITDKKRRAVRWHHLSYDYTDGDIRLLGGALAFADLVILLFELSDEFDRLGCP